MAVVRRVRSKRGGSVTIWKHSMMTENDLYCTPRPMIPTLSTDTFSTRILPFTVGIILSEPAKSGTFEAGDIALSGAAEASVTSLQTVSNQHFTANLEPTSGGSLSIELTAGKVELHNVPGHFNEDSNVLTVTIDSTRPTPVLAAPAASPDLIVESDPFIVTVIFDEAIKTSTLTLSDFSVTNASVVSVTETGASSDTFSIGVAPDTEGGVQVQLPEGKIEDLVGNLNAASNVLVVTYEMPPTTIPPPKAEPPTTTEDAALPPGGGDGPPDGENGVPPEGENGEAIGPPDPSDGETLPPLPPNIPFDQVEISSGSSDGDPAEGCQMSYSAAGDVRLACADSESRKFISLAESSVIVHVEGSRHDDTLRGNSQDNTLVGGDGADTLDGRGGVDQLAGGRGADTFVVSDVPCDVTILDFDTGSTHDRVNLVSFASLTKMSDLQERMTSGSVILDLDPSHRVRILHRTLQEIFDPRYFLLTSELETEGVAKDEECGWFTYSRPECVDTILSIVLGIVGVAGLGIGTWQVVHNFLRRGQNPTPEAGEKPTEKEEGMDHRKRSISDTRDSRKRRYLETKTERRVLGSDFVQGLQEEKPSGDESGSRGRVEDAAASDLSFLSYL
ncbi:unnamed protein product [Vitrella brassicaformis CCMP3155]|uniref:Bacterial Ig-like domain-containing protein n=2 Tax=Vitrella brassicaformis TaxID=1169539 RepID=A0A0G4H730_VITBC|nr:unnamed protein product [Vitrella brassicaformis CCMP3155]|eukprot:CEM39694.1 unnamed protein product [Vitrella brassicaformis CCMP3155]